ncbi:MAG: SDR family NAD(P)-dependent oxidoreductase, partial [Armatimonadota bacterium]|nr:SDR family NAD(P)-dependent oxidoreductase [Armatimonadota bacterium]
MDLMLKGKTAVITGGSVGIGLAVAEALAAEGVDLALCARNEERLSEAGEGIRKAHGVRVLTAATDVTRPDDILALSQQV